jgi:hypothetical protein
VPAIDDTKMYTSGTGISCFASKVHDSGNVAFSFTPRIDRL